MEVPELICREDLVKSKESGKFWVAIENSVYNVSDFLNIHPGGEEVLLEQIGKDATEVFKEVGHSKEAEELMKNFKIGELVDSETETKEEESQSPKQECTLLRKGLCVLKYISMSLTAVFLAIFFYELLLFKY